jgi:hypothetical protein
MNPLSGNAGLYLDHLCGPAIRSPTLCSHAFANLGSLLRWERRCRTAALQGARNIAGRKAYIVSLGPDQCNRASAAGYLLLGREIAWLDTSTLVLLRLDRFFPGTQRLLVRTVTTHVIFK